MRNLSFRGFGGTVLEGIWGSVEFGMGERKNRTSGDRSLEESVFAYGRIFLNGFAIGFVRFR